jgi:glycerol-3-phosphate dehydrogenase
MNSRHEKFAKLKETKQTILDILIVGGGATGLGLAVDSATRGYNTALIEAGDFAQATSSRSTKLIHGGVRYLASGQVHLVYEALHERKVMLRNAPHLVHPLRFVTPAYRWFDLPYYGAGLKLYDLLSGQSSLGPTNILSLRETLELLPQLETKDLKGSVTYFDGQFDDARLVLALARTAEDHGATVLNYARCQSFLKEGNNVTGVSVLDIETGSETEVYARTVINATGIFVDQLREVDEPAAENMLSVSRGTHIVVSGNVLSGENAIMIPKTPDGRVIFAIPWQGRTVVGTTDLPAASSVMEPGHEDAEIDYLLETINPYLASRLSRTDILSVFSGLRPLVTGKATKTSSLSREHSVEVSPSGLITVAGGKWTTYRRMAEDTLDTAIARGMLPTSACITRTVPLHGTPSVAANPASALAHYGTDAEAIRSLWNQDSQTAELLDPELPYTLGEALYAVRYEMARTVEDVLSRRTRALLLNARAAERAAPQVAALLANELGHSPEWVTQEIAAFTALSQSYYRV